MTGVAALIGLLIGWAACWASERLAYDQPNGRSQKWLWLHRGIMLASSAMFGYLWERFGPSWDMLRLAGSYGFLIVVSLVDLKSRRVPNTLVYPALALALLFQWLISPQALVRAILGGGMAFLIFYLTAWLRPGDLGGGDVKLAALLGAGFGFPGILWALLVGVVAGGVVVVALLLIWRWSAKSRIPYAPFLCLGAWVALVYNPLPLLLH